MTRDQLLRLLLVERFAPHIRLDELPAVSLSVAEIRLVHHDDDLTTYTRREALNNACTGFDTRRTA